MDIGHLAIFLATSIAVAAAPGPTVLQIFAHALSGDPRRPASLIAGAFAANALLVGATIAGIGALVMASETAFTVLKWVGAGYLIWLGVHYWRRQAAAIETAQTQQRVPAGALFAQAALTSLTNPKGLAFYIAFLPQFTVAGPDLHGQLAFLGGLYLGLCLITDSLYALAGLKLSRLSLSARMVRLKNRATGVALVAAGLSLLRPVKSALG